MSTDDSFITIEVIHENEPFTLTELCEICQLEPPKIEEMIEYEIIVADVEDDALFSNRQLDRLLKATRLHHDLEINVAGVALALELLDTIDELQKQIRLHRP